MTRLVLLGPPGAGKGTQAKNIADTYGIPAISTGEIFRVNMASDTELGRRAKSYIDRGELVPDSVLEPMIGARLGAPDAAAGFLLDGFPRTLAQAEMLQELLAAQGVGLDAVLEIAATESEVIERILRRAELESRSDDSPEIIAHRLRRYHEVTEPITDYYAQRDLLLRVDGMGEVDEISQRVANVLTELFNTDS